MISSSSFYRFIDQYPKSLLVKCKGDDLPIKFSLLYKRKTIGKSTKVIIGQNNNNNHHNSTFKAQKPLKEESESQLVQLRYTGTALVCAFVHKNVDTVIEQLCEDIEQHVINGNFALCSNPRTFRLDPESVHVSFQKKTDGEGRLIFYVEGTEYIRHPLNIPEEPSFINVFPSSCPDEEQDLVTAFPTVNIFFQKNPVQLKDKTITHYPFALKVSKHSPATEGIKTLQEAITEHLLIGNIDSIQKPSSLVVNFEKQDETTKALNFTINA